MDESGSTVMIDEYEYDEKGRKIRHIIKRGDGEIDVTNEFTYDEEDRMIRESYTSSFHYAYTNTYTYDAHDNLLKIDSTMTDSAGTHEQTIEFKYKLVYIPFDYSEEEWTDICDVVLYW
jgi:hypothetical protein